MNFWRVSELSSVPSLAGSKSRYCFFNSSRTVGGHSNTPPRLRRDSPQGENLSILRYNYFCKPSYRFSLQIKFISEFGRVLVGFLKPWYCFFNSDKFHFQFWSGFGRVFEIPLLFFQCRQISFLNLVGFWSDFWNPVIVFSIPIKFISEFGRVLVGF